MKKLKQGLLLAVLLLLGAYVTIPLIKQQIGIWHSGKISDLFNSFGYNYLYDRSILTDEGSVRIGLIRVDDGYCLVTVSLPSLWEEAVAQYTLSMQRTPTMKQCGPGTASAAPRRSPSSSCCWTRTSPVAGSWIWMAAAVLGRSARRSQ